MFRYEWELGHYINIWNYECILRIMTMLDIVFFFSKKKKGPT